MASTKTKIARKLLSAKERKDGTPIFNSKGWNARSASIALRVKKQQDSARMRAEKRRKTRQKTK